MLFYNLVVGQIYQNGPANLHVLNDHNFSLVFGNNSNVDFVIIFVHGPCQECLHESLHVLSFAAVILGTLIIFKVRLAVEIWSFQEILLFAELGYPLQVGVFMCESSELRPSFCTESSLETSWTYLPRGSTNISSLLKLPINHEDEENEDFAASILRKIEAVPQNSNSPFQW